MRCFARRLRGGGAGAAHPSGVRLAPLLPGRAPASLRAAAKLPGAGPARRVVGAAGGARPGLGRLGAQGSDPPSCGLCPAPGGGRGPPSRTRARLHLRRVRGVYAVAVLPGPSLVRRRPRDLLRPVGVAVALCRGGRAAGAVPSAGFLTPPSPGVPGRRRLPVAGPPSEDFPVLFWVLVPLGTVAAYALGRRARPPVAARGVFGLSFLSPQRCPCGWSTRSTSIPSRCCGLLMLVRREWSSSGRRLGGLAVLASPSWPTRSASPASDEGESSVDRHEVDHEDRASRSGTMRAGRPCGAVGQLGRDGHLRRPPLPSPGHPVPARDHLAGAEREGVNGCAAVPGGVELLAGGERHADVLDRHLSPALARRPLPLTMSSLTSLRGGARGLGDVGLDARVLERGLRLCITLLWPDAFGHWSSPPPASLRRHSRSAAPSTGRAGRSSRRGAEASRLGSEARRRALGAAHAEDLPYSGLDLFHTRSLSDKGALTDGQDDRNRPWHDQLVHGRPRRRRTHRGRERRGCTDYSLGRGFHGGRRAPRGRSRPSARR